MKSKLRSPGFVTHNSRSRRSASSITVSSSPKACGQRARLSASSLQARVSSALRAGDILLEKTPFRLTDSFIPGHWGHAAIWIGTPDELRELGIWDHPLVRTYRREIESGRGVVEALRSGVKMNPLQQFMNIDDLAVLREPTLPPAQRAELR